MAPNDAGTAPGVGNTAPVSAGSFFDRRVTLVVYSSGGE